MTYRNLAELQRCQAERLGARPALRWKRYGHYHNLGWDRYRADALACAAALIDAGVAPGDRIGLLSENRVEWLIADVGIATAGAVNVPPHAPLAARQVQYQLADADVAWLFVSSHEQLQKVLLVRAELPRLRGVVLFDRAPGRNEAISWDGFLQRGRRVQESLQRELARREAALGPESIATIMYTSGTTGHPKGVMLTHGNLLSNAQAVLSAFPMPADAVIFSWLPFSHIYARTVDHYLALVAGALLCLAESAECVIDNLQEVQATSMNAVPRFYEKVAASVADLPLPERAARLRDLFGPRMSRLASGGAPLPPAIAETYRSAGLLVLQGYGLTESSPVIAFNRETAYKLHSVGLPLPGVEVAIAADGEVLTRGPHVMKGYWKNPQATAEVLIDGWLHTGDLGQLDADGFLTITGRKKDLLVLSNGKKVVPAAIEGLLVADSWIDQAVIHGEGRNFLTALIVPHWENLRPVLQARGVADGQGEEHLARHPVVRALLQQRVATLLADVAPWEQVRKFLVLSRPFTVASGELTVSLKLRRRVVLERYQALLEALYAEA